jgi:hypothetical protein
MPSDQLSVAQTQDRRHQSILADSQAHLLVACFVLLLNIPARLLYIFNSLWLDEAWVANSVVEATIKQMLFYDRWVQSTPPLTLLLMRGATSLMGPGELAFRIVALLAGLAAIALFALAAHRIFRWPLGLLATTFLATNYWAIRYSQEAKQYGCDLLMASAFVLLIYNTLNSDGIRHPRILVLTAGLLGSLLSLPVMFFFPSIVIALGIRELLRRSGRGSWGKAARCLAGPAFVGAVLAAGLAAQYFVYWRPNIPVSFRADLAHYSMAANGPLAVLRHFLANLAELLLPTNFRSLHVLSPLAVVLVGAGLARSLTGAVKGDLRSVSILFAGAVPPLTAVVLSFANIYPIVPQPRLILWMLPCCVILLFFALEPLFGYVSSRLPIRAVRVVVLVACVSVTAATLVVLWMHPRPVEDNRAAVTFLAAHAQAGDRILVHAGMSEQFALYSHLVVWQPPPVYFANSDWPCCSINIEKRVSNPKARTLEEDVDSAVQGIHPGRVWVLTPSGDGRHWSGNLSPVIGKVPEYMAAHNCAAEENRLFGFTEVSWFHCR